MTPLIEVRFSPHLVSEKIIFVIYSKEWQLYDHLTSPLSIRGAASQEVF